MEDLKLKILVTGGAGFIGSHLVDALIKKGARVFIIDNLSTGHKENINPKAVFYNMDMVDKKVASVFKKEKPDIVFHLAHNANMHKSVEDPIFDAQGIVGSLNIFDLARENCVKKIIMASSAMVYGNYPPRLLTVTEEHLTQPGSPYAISKTATENYLRFFNRMYKLPIVILRYPTVYGPRQVGGAMADYIRKIAKDQSGDMFGNGKLTRDYVYVDDIIRANLLALDYKGKELIFNLGSSKEITLNNLHQKIPRLFNKASLKPVYHPARLGEVLRFCVSNKKAKKELDWQPTVTLDEGLRKMI
jgi:UDP-glucose 4-epimerase